MALNLDFPASTARIRHRHRQHSLWRWRAARPASAHRSRPVRSDLRCLRARIINGVAVIVPLTGPDGPVGTSISNAAKLALLDTGEKSLRITIYNSAAPGGAAAAAEKAIAEGNRLILGPLLADDVRAAAPVARRAERPGHRLFQRRGRCGRWRLHHGLHARPVDRPGRRLCARRRAPTASARWCRPGFTASERRRRCWARCASRGGRVAAIETYDRSQASITAAARRLNAKGAYRCSADRGFQPDGGAWRAGAQSRPAPARHRAVGHRPDDRQQRLAARRLVRGRARCPVRQAGHPLSRPIRQDALSARQPWL